MRKLTKDEIDLAFEQYKNNKRLTQQELANQLGVCEKTIWRNFSRHHPDEIKDIAKLKSARHSEKISDEQVYEAFQRYRKGIPATELEKEYGLGHGALVHKIRKLIGKGEKFNDAKIINRKSCGLLRRKVSGDKIEFYFNKYKYNKISLMSIANKLNVSEDVIIRTFRKEFGEEYTKIARSRRDERKVTKEGYERAFEEYEKTPISLTKIANSLEISINSLRPRFIRLFGKRYHKVAREKLKGGFLNKRGRIAEKLALEYLKMSGIEIEDVRRNCVIKGGLLRPDFVTGENFIEVKSYFVKYSSKRLKGYKEILNSYLNKETTDGGVLRFGIIISLSGFSKKVWEQAMEDGVTLIDYHDLERAFDNANRQDLIDLLEHHFLPRWEL